MPAINIMAKKAVPSIKGISIGFYPSEPYSGDPMIPINASPIRRIVSFIYWNTLTLSRRIIRLFYDESIPIYVCNDLLPFIKTEPPFLGVRLWPQNRKTPPVFQSPFGLQSPRSRLIAGTTPGLPGVTGSGTGSSSVYTTLATKVSEPPLSL